jgi:benzoylformate decarboxylase
MRGRDVFMDSLRAHGVRHIFGNPGTTESPLLDSLAGYPEIDYVVALHEGIAAGAAAYYAQATGRTGIVNLHVAPGLGNAIGMTFSAMKANAPMIITAGQQDTRLRLRGPVLGHDLVAMATPVTKWAVQVERGDEMADIMHRAFKIAHDPPYGPVFVALPIDVMEQETANAARPAGGLYRAQHPDPDGIADMAARILAARAPVIVAGDDIARAGASAALTALAEATGAPVWFEGLHAQAVMANSHTHLRGGLPFDAAAIQRALGDSDLVLLLGGPFFEEVWFTPGSPFPDGAQVLQIEESASRLALNFAPDAGLTGAMAPALTALSAALEAGADDGYRTAARARGAALAARKQADREAQANRLERSKERRPISMALAMSVLADGLPDDAVVVEEAITASIDLERSFDFSGPGDYFSGRGGGIGQGLAGALGTQTALPGRRVACISGDGSAMYSIQALWTAAHHKLPVIFVILANREYRVLKHNLDIYRQRFDAESNRPYPHMDLGGPTLGFVEMAAGMGVAGERVGEPDQLAAALKTALSADAPYLIEVAIEGKP